MADNQIQFEIRYPFWFRLINGAGILVIFGMALHGWLAYRQEEIGWGLPTAVIMFLLALLWLSALAATPQLVQFGLEYLVIRRWFGTVTLA